MCFALDVGFRLTGPFTTSCKDSSWFFQLPPSLRTPWVCQPSETETLIDLCLFPETLPAKKGRRGKKTATIVSATTAKRPVPRSYVLDQELNVRPRPSPLQHARKAKLGRRTVMTVAAATGKQSVPWSCVSDRKFPNARFRPFRLKLARKGNPGTMAATTVSATTAKRPVPRGYVSDQELNVRPKPSPLQHARMAKLGRRTVMTVPAATGKQSVPWCCVLEIRKFPPMACEDEKLEWWLQWLCLQEWPACLYSENL